MQRGNMKWLANAAVIMMLTTACGSEGESSTVEAEPASSTTVTSPASTTSTASTTTSPPATTTPQPSDTSTTTLPPTTTTVPEPVVAAVAISQEVSFETGLGTFEVTEGAEQLGCAAGTSREYLYSGNWLAELTCDTGGTGTITLGIAFYGGFWHTLEATGDFAPLSGYGDYRAERVDDTFFETITGQVVIDGPTFEVSTPAATYSRLVPRSSPCVFAFGAADATGETATVDDRLLHRSFVTGETTDYGPAPAPCAMFLGDPQTGRAAATDLDQTTMWLGPLGGPFETEVSFEEATSMMSRSIRANRLVLSDSSGFFLIDATTGEQIGEPISGSFGIGRASRTFATNGDGTLFAIATIGDGDAELIVGSTETAQVDFRIELPSTVAAVRFDDSAGEVITLGAEGVISTIDLAAQEIVSQVDSTAIARHNGLGVRTDGKLVIVSSAHAEVIDRRTGPTGDAIAITDPFGAVMPDGTFYTIWDTTISVYDDFTIAD